MKETTEKSVNRTCEFWRMNRRTGYFSETFSVDMDVPVNALLSADEDFLFVWLRTAVPDRVRDWGDDGILCFIFASDITDTQGARYYSRRVVLQPWEFDQVLEVF